MKQIYNEGRVVGLSHYEIYVRQLLSLNPEATPMTEREWLTSTLANNSSMILKIPAGTTKGIHDYLLPENSALAACTQVFGSMFAGQVTVDETGYWATRVDDYGDAISNTEELAPETPGTPDYVPSKYDPTQENTVIAERTAEFIKIREAFVIQPGDWEDVIYPPDPEPNDENTIIDDDDDDGSDDTITTSETEGNTSTPEVTEDPNIDYDEIVTWDSPLIDSRTVYVEPSDIVLTTEYNEWLIEARTGTRREMIEDLSQYTDDPDAEIICWDTPLITESDDYEHPSDVILTTEYGEWIIGEKWGTREQMVEDLDQYKEDPEPGPIPPEPEPVVPARAKRYLEPDFHKNGFVRILLTDETTEDLYILLHGFVDKTLLMGEVSFPYQGWSTRPQDGDFLGPAMYPWACPIILVISTDVQDALLRQQAAVNQELLGLALNLRYRTLYLGTLHIVTWDTPLLTELGDALLTENGENLMASKSGTAAEMWQEGDEDEILYYAPWWDESGNDLVTEDKEIIWVPKIGTITEMIAEGGVF